MQEDSLASLAGCLWGLVQRYAQVRGRRSQWWQQRLERRLWRQIRLDRA